jgi:hypothetical protein
MPNGIGVHGDVVPAPRTGPARSLIGSQAAEGCVRSAFPFPFPVPYSSFSAGLFAPINGDVMTGQD